jgi:hypothetical protein
MTHEITRLPTPGWLARSAGSLVNDEAQAKTGTGGAA